MLQKHAGGHFMLEVAVLLCYLPWMDNSTEDRQWSYPEVIEFKLKILKMSDSL
jgi:hypothetical protein